MQEKHHLTELRWEWQRLKYDEHLPQAIRNHSIKKLMNTLEMKFCVTDVSKCNCKAANSDALNFYEELARHL